MKLTTIYKYLSLFWVTSCVTHIYSTTKKHKKHSCLIFKFFWWHFYSQSKLSQYYKLTTLESQKVVAQKLYSTTYTECIKPKEHRRQPTHTRRHMQRNTANWEALIINTHMMKWQSSMHYLKTHFYKTL